MPRYLVWICGLVFIYGTVVWLAHKSLYYPMRYPSGDWRVQNDLSAEDVWLQTADKVKLHSWWLPRADARIVTLHLHGNAGNVTHRAYRARRILEAGSALLLLDYRGYGRSEGSPSESGLYADAKAAYEHLLAAGWNSRQIVIHGESLGSAVAVDLAIKAPCGGVILEAPFSSARAVAGRVLPIAGPLFVWGFDSKAKIRELRAPLLVIHGDRDEIISPDLGKELFDAAPQPKSFWTVAGAGHNDLPLVGGTEYRRRLADFYSIAANSR